MLHCDSYSMPFLPVYFSLGKKFHCYKFGEVAWQGMLYWYVLVDTVIRSLTMWPNSKSSPAQIQNVPGIPTFTNSLLPVSYFFLLTFYSQSAYYLTCLMRHFKSWWKLFTLEKRMKALSLYTESGSEKCWLKYT